MSFSAAPRAAKTKSTQTGRIAAQPFHAWRPLSAKGFSPPGPARRARLVFLLAGAASSLASLGVQVMKAPQAEPPAAKL